MNKLKVGVLALLLGASAAMATAKNNTANHKWGRDPISGEYTDVTGLNEGVGYDCSLGAQACTEEYPEGVDPNDQDNDQFPGTALPENRIDGSFSM